jgi:hypothetical protein
MVAGFCLSFFGFPLLIIIPPFLQTIALTTQHINTLFCFFFNIVLSALRLSPLGTAATIGLLYQPQMIDDDDYGAVGGMRIGKGNRSTRRKPAPAPLCSPQMPHEQTRAAVRLSALRAGRPLAPSPKNS